MIDYKEIILFSDQPITCPKCGSRTEILLDLSHTKNQTQIHQCLALRCNFKFVVEHEIELVKT